MKVCDFCGKSQEHVKRMITSPKADICNECVLLCMEVLLDDVAFQYKEIDFPMKVEGSNT